MDAELTLQPDAARLTLPRFLEDVAARHGERVALRDERGELSYAALRHEARALARGLVALGASKGTRVAVWMANRREWVVSAFASSLTGAVLVPVNTFATPGERDYILRHSDAALLLMQPELLKHAFLADLVRDHPEAAAGEGAIRCAALPQLRHVVCLDPVPDASVLPLSQLAELGAGVDDGLLDALADEIAPDDHALVIYTSGTTARPKGVVHRHRAPAIQSWRFAELMGLGPDDRVFTAQPFFWTAGIAMSLGATLAAGATLLLQETFDPAGALALIEAERATTVHAWPHQEKSMAEHPEATARDLSSVRKVEFSNPLAQVVGLEKDSWGMYGSYGLSETFTLATAFPADAPTEARHASNGPVLAGNVVRIVDPETGEPLPQGERGEIAVKGLTLMAGYHKVAPEVAFDAEGFFRTQDGGFLDADGRLHWKGRLSNLIKTGGANVSPLEIEAAVADLAGVKTSAAIGLPHPTLGEAIVLCLVSTAQSDPPDPTRVAARLAETLAAYKRPRAILVFAPDEVSYTGSQKLQLEPLREQARARLAADGALIAGIPVEA